MRAPSLTSRVLRGLEAALHAAAELDDPDGDIAAATRWRAEMAAYRAEMADELAPTGHIAVECPACKRRLLSRGDGYVRTHRTLAGTRCDGSGAKPRTGWRPATDEEIERGRSTTIDGGRRGLVPCVKESAAAGRRREAQKKS